MNNSISIRSLRNFAILFLLVFGFTTNTIAQEQPDSLKGPSAAELAKANNPLADMVAFNVQNYYTPKFNGSDMSMNTTWFRFAAPTGNILWRASLPLQTSSQVYWH